jgi:glutaredoxin
MRLRTRLVAASIALVSGSAPCLSHSQSIADLLRLIPKSSSGSDLIGTIKSLSEITLGRVEPGASPENADGKIVLYRTAWCGYCKRAAAYMQKRNIGFVERDIETNSGYKAEFTRLGGKGVPLIVFGGKTMSGFDEGAFERNYADFKQTQDISLSPAVSTAPNTSSANQAVRSGDVLVAKISGTNVYAEPSRSRQLTVLSKIDEMIYMGEEREGFYHVTTQRGEGWIDKLLVKKQ